MLATTSDNAGLSALDDCQSEWNRCLRWERFHQREHEDWMRDNAGENPRILAIVSYWRERRLRLEESFKELREPSPA